MCKRGLQGFQSLLRSHVPIAQGVQTYLSCVAQSSSNQKANSAPPSSAINEEREEHPQRTEQSGNVLPKNIKCLKHKDTGQRKDTARQRCQKVRSSRTPHPGQNMVLAGPLLSATPLTPSIHLRLTSATHRSIPLACKAEGTESLAQTQHHSSSSISLHTTMPPQLGARGQSWRQIQLFYLIPIGRGCFLLPSAKVAHP